jgi:hypothetical protein
MKVKMEANITLILREKNVKLLLKAVQQLKPDNDGEAHNQRYLLDLLKLLSVPV